MRVHHTISGEVLSVDIPTDAKSVHHPSRPWNEWDDRTTPRTELPLRFLVPGVRSLRASRDFVKVS